MALTLDLVLRIPQAPALTSFLLGLPSSGVFPTVIYILSFYGGLIIFLTEAVISFNRASTIFLATRHDRVWSVAMKWVYLFILIAPLAINWNLCFQSVGIKLKDSTRPELGVSWREFDRQKFPWMKTGLYFFYTGFVTALWSFGWNLYTLIHLVKRNVFAKSVHANKKSKKALRLFVFSCYLFLMQFGMVAMLYVGNYTSFGGALLTYNPLIIDACHFTVPWIFVFMQRDVRHAVRNQMFRMARMKVPESTGTMVVQKISAKISPNATSTHRTISHAII
uniref:Serpentine receptor class gamma n=1 Tax=Panagrellus redivivus TaxID=6233 RepID=A0A7E4W1A8_PANRE